MGLIVVSSESLVPRPPANIKTFIYQQILGFYFLEIACPEYFRGGNGFESDWRNQFYF
ncbi:hypothetical protein NC99_03370 [Sunxiuqinia dokdonensis]|uniref:Uncharacterized protein n=1 Tax=Sunxiuqinia dokdonensis TaxID=1409788 RepID=A0A0L8VFH5_9BACT|nr:hypothetical protein NC99_03370 [Sunxiuqinia dokdonensis]